MESELLLDPWGIIGGRGERSMPHRSMLHFVREPSSQDSLGFLRKGCPSSFLGIPCGEPATRIPPHEWMDGVFFRTSHHSTVLERSRSKMMIERNVMVKDDLVQRKKGEVPKCHCATYPFSRRSLDQLGTKTRTRTVQEMLQEKTIARKGMIL